MYGDADILVVGQIAAKIKIFEVYGHEAAVGGADDAVENELCCGDVGGFGCFVPGVINAVAAGSPADTFGVGFFSGRSAQTTRT